MTTLTAPLPFTPLEVGGLTLEQRLDRTWGELQAEGEADCPVCGERMTNAGAASACTGCASELH